MKTTRVVAAHLAGPTVNGVDGCYARGESGMCPGVEQAVWLNSLGPDEAPYGTSPHRYPGSPHAITNLEVRANWVRGGNHVCWEGEKKPPTCPHCKGSGHL